MNIPSALRSLILIALLFSVSHAQTPPIRIMPLGDSITDGSALGTAGLGGYRGRLYSLLTTAGYNVDYVGTLTINGAGIPDQNHEGHSGWIIGQLDSNIAAWLGSMADPDVVLMHIGTNDFGSGTDTPNAINRLDALILKIATLRPFAHIVVTNLMERNEPFNSQIAAQFNPFVQARVNAHAAAGRRVTFLDMRAACPLADMPDQLHPNQTGYDKMADAWLPAIQAVIGTQGDALPPGIYRAVGNGDLAHVAITFSKPVADSAAVAANFAISGLSVTAAALDATKRVVTLTTSQQTMDAAYTITVNGVVDRTAGALALPADSTVAFVGARQRGYLNNVAESNCYTLALSLDVPTLANYGTTAPSYGVDNRAAIGPFSRVAYYVELQQAGGELQFVWASMDAFTTDANKLGVPTVASAANFQQGVGNLNVVSNVAGVVNGARLAGNLEFWPTNYSQANGAGVPGASAALYDFGDTATAGSYGSMQLHNTAAAQTIFAFNNWGGTATGTNADIGIGNGAGANPDYTFANNAGTYTVKTIQVLVQTIGDVTAPTMAAATALGRAKVKVTFSEPLAAASVRAQNFSLSNGVIILGATLAANQRDVTLATTLHPAGTPLTLTASEVRDTSPNANRMTAANIAVAPAALPPEIVANVGAAAIGYELVYSLNIPTTGNLVSGAGFTNYAVNNSAEAGAFSRVAYYMELRTGAATPNFVWASMNAFTNDAGRIGVPTPASGAVFQQAVANLNILSNAPGIVTGSGIATGNIEFWPTNYSAPNAVPVPGASATNYDWGDTRTTTGTYGSMQLHNHGASQTVFALNNWGTVGNTGNALCVGIGNNPAPVSAGVDWTFANNAATYSSRVLHVLILPANTDLAGPVPTRAVGSTTLNRLVVTFDEPLADSSAAPANFSIAGLSVTGATLLAGNREIALTTSAQTPAAVYTVAVSGVRDRSAGGNASLPGAAINFTAHTPPAVLAGIADAAGYDLIHRLAIPTATPQWNLNTIPYAVDEAKYGERTFDRVAYLLELDGNWVYASFDAHTNQLAKIGVPTLGVTATAFQQIVARMNVESNVAGIVTGTDITTGNIEFWGGNYSQPNALAIPGASATTYDFGDTMSTGGHGSMQIHNHGAGQVLMAYNNWGSNAGGTSDTGIGNSTGANPDWTFSSSASASTVRNLYVLARPGGTPSGAAPVIYAQPCPRFVNPGANVTFAVQAVGAATYQWRKNGVPIEGAIFPWLDLPAVTLDDAADYDIVLTAPTLVTTASLAATLTVNSPPTYAGTVIFAQRDTTADIAASALLTRAADVNGGPLALTAVSAASTSGGTVALGAGVVHYTPPAGFTGNDTFTITITDPLGLAATATVNVHVSTTGAAPFAGSITFQSNGTLAGYFAGVPAGDYILQRSTDLLGWFPLKITAPAPDGTLPFTDPAPPPGKAFYRIIVLPGN